MINVLITLSLGNIISLLLGTLSGFGIFIVIYWKRKYRFIIKPTIDKLQTISDDQKKKIKQIVSLQYREYLEIHKDKKKQKRLLEDTSKYTLMSSVKNYFNEIPVLFYPDSEHPELEITIEQLFSFINYIPNRIREIIDIINIDGLEDLKVSTILSIVVYGKKIYGLYTARLIKILIKILNISFMIRNLIYFPYWIKKGTSTSLTRTFSNMLIFSLFDMIGRELAYIYSRE